MKFFRIYLVVTFAFLTGYTLLVVRNHGWNLLPVFFSNIVEMTWSGQFNFDFISFLGLSGIWVAWRHQFSKGAIALGIVAFFGGMLFLAPYLLLASLLAKGDPETLLLGKNRMSR
ncbi:MAG: hypothetical protein EOM25_03840 [Deltaproteobacteria bacterium]|nr:hypothetical protein [Deltaproteobacteria bacterium]